MGLDMYLSEVLYVSRWDHASPSEKAKADDILELVGIAPTKHTTSLTVSVQVGYWRKANAIHKWFVDNVQGGVDECQKTEVSWTELSELREVCRQVLDVAETGAGTLNTGTTYGPQGAVTHHTEEGTVITNPDAVAELLPATEGFFFGDANYNEWYLQDVEDTIKLIDMLEARKPDERMSWFEYQSSW